ncbi:MAG: Txe/YoeB family addiction module toxin [Tannerellaceae bacterium]|jgi:toxin YoeB|nr:Txe/YoeB family addiction module toxin [Tannerellaceae bacterium]
MSNYFLLNEAINTEDYVSFEKGILDLLPISEEKEDGDNIWRHESIYELTIVLELYTSHWEKQNTTTLLKFIEQMSSLNNYIASSEEFDCIFPGEHNAFLGIDFSNTIIEEKRQIKGVDSFRSVRQYYYINLSCKGDEKKMRDCLRKLYGKKYEFAQRAIEEMTYWNEKNQQIYKRVHKLLDDIKLSPLEGEIGKAEILKGRGTRSKRIDQEHRIEYYLEKNTVHVLACRGHYTD